MWVRQDFAVNAAQFPGARNDSNFRFLINDTHSLSESMMRRRVLAVRNQKLGLDTEP